MRTSKASGATERVRSECADTSAPRRCFRFEWMNTVSRMTGPSSAACAIASRPGVTRRRARVEIGRRESTTERKETRAMNYMCLIYQDEGRMDALPAAEWNALIAEHRAFDAALEQSGHYLVARPLERSVTATTVRLRNGKASVTDGPFAETKEQFAGFYLIEAKDLDDALAVAARIPSARYGPVEVRPVRDLARMERTPA